MLFTRETDYAFRILRNLNEEEPRSIRSIIDREYISSAIAYKVARKLELAGIISSVRGNAGGYMLSRGLDNITMYDVYQVIDPTSVLNECLKPGVECPLNCGDEACKVHRELERVQENLYQDLRSKSLAQIMAE